MYKGNENLRHDGQEVEYTPEQVQELIRCKNDPIYFANKYFYIQTVDEGERLITLRNYQKKVIKAFYHPPKGKRHFILRSGRQSGKTTCTSLIILMHILFESDKTVGILANKEATAVEILSRVKYAFEKLPIWMQVGIKADGWNKKTIKLENGSSAIAAGTSKSAISGKTLSLLYVDEFSKIEPHIATEFQNSVFPTVESSQTGRIFISSTPLGLNHFADMFNKAEAGNSYLAMWIKWDEVEGRDDNWKRRIIRDYGLAHFRQEYMCLFFGSSCTLVEGEFIEKIEVKDPVEYRFADCFLIYEKPIKDAYYIISVDVGKGVGGDYSVCQVLKINGLHDVEQVAVYRSNLISVPNFSQIVIEINRYYGMGPLMIENNDVGASLCNDLWYNWEHDTIINVDPKAIGVRSTKKTKFEANFSLKEYMENDWLKIVDKQTKHEMSRYEEQTNNKFSAAKGETDDAVTSLIWGTFLMFSKFYEGPGNETLETRIIKEANKIEENWLPSVLSENSNFDEEISDFMNGNF